MNLVEMRPLFAAPLKDFALPRDSDIADRYLNLSYIEVFESHRWAFRKKTGSLTLIKNLTGTATVTQFNGSNSASAKTVTGASTYGNEVLGRYFRATGSSYWHKIVAISGTTLYLDSEIIDVNGSTTYEIWKRFYYLKSDADVIYDFDNWKDSRLSPISESGLVDSLADTSETGNPYTYAPFGVDPYDDIQYSTGTIAGTNGNNYITGSGTNWLSSGYDTGDILENNNKEYYIKRIESDDRIALFNTLAGPLSGNYKLKKNNPFGFQFYNSPSDYKVLPYTYLSRAYPLIHPTEDKIMLSRRFIPAIITRAIYFRMRDTNDQRMVTTLQIYDSELAGLKAKVEILNPRFEIFGPKIPHFMPGRG